MPRPRVILHNAVSLDGRLDGFPVDLGTYYGLAASFGEDATLVGSETILKAPLEPLGEESPPAGKPAGLPLLVVPDSRGQVRNWNFWRQQPYWRDILVICARRTSTDYLDYLRENKIDFLVLGEIRADLGLALEELATRGIKAIRVDSGGLLNGALLQAGLADEVSLLIHPALVGVVSLKSIFQPPDSAGTEKVIGLKLVHLERLEGDLVWLRYLVV